MNEMNDEMHISNDDTSIQKPKLKNKKQKKRNVD